MSKTIDLSFDGYWREVNVGGVPNDSGIYLVYVCTYNQNEKNVSIRKLIYIGETEKVRERIQNHEKKEECWDKKLNSGEVLCFSFAPVQSPDRERAEAALIFKHKPECNEEYVHNFPYEETSVNPKGKCTFINPSFTVHKTQ